MSKQVSAERIDRLLQASCTFAPASTRRMAIVGGVSGNIGDAISDLARATGFRVDSRDLADGFDATRDRFKFDAGCDILVLAQGTMSLAWIGEQNEEDIQAPLDAILLASMRMVNEFVQTTREQPWLKYIVLIGSMAHRNVLNASSAYCAAKAGLAAFGRCAAWELAPRGYRVYTVHPGNVVDGPMSERTMQELARLHDLDAEAARRYWDAGRVLPEHVDKAEIARVVLELVDGRHDHMAGANIEFPAGQR